MSIQLEHDAYWDLQHADDGVVKVQNDDEKFEVHLDAQHFTPEEIEVKVEGHHVDVHAQHKSREDRHGAVTRRMSRSFQLPEDVNEHAIKSFLSPRGTLVITAFKKSNTSYPRILLEDDAWIGVDEGGVVVCPADIDTFPVQRSPEVARGTAIPSFAF